MKLPQWVDAIFLFAISVYVPLGMGLTPFHGDEAMQLYAANDYYTLLSDRAPERLMTIPPYPVDSDQHLRILNGSLNRYAIGLTWQLAAHTRDELPPRPGWQWALSYDDNAAQGYVPTPAQLTTARVPSTLFHIASVITMFLLARALGGRRLAYMAALFFALHPALLLNGRRALQESAMICFGLLALWCAVGLTHRAGAGKVDAITGVPSGRHAYALWALLALVCGLTLASKHSGIVFIVAAGVWVFFGGNLPVRNPIAMTQRTLGYKQFSLCPLRLYGSIILVMMAALGLFIALSPALWNDPIARLNDLIVVRRDLFQSQVRAAGEATSLSSRLGALVTQPFVAPLQFYEAPTFSGSPVDVQAIAYRASWMGGVPTDNLIGVVLSLCAGVGIVASLLPRWRTIHPAHAWGLLLTLLIVAISLLANPLPWQRYYLPLTTLLCVYAALGLQTFMRAFSGLAPQSRA